MSRERNEGQNKNTQRQATNVSGNVVKFIRLKQHYKSKQHAWQKRGTESFVSLFFILAPIELWYCLLFDMGIKLGKRPTWRTILYHVFIFIFNSLRVSSTSCSSSGETNCVNTTSGNCHSVYCRWPCRVQVGSSLPTCTRHGHRQLPEVALTQFVSPDDEHDVLETRRELNIKINT
jgi:hypothetical protein